MTKIIKITHNDLGYTADAKWLPGSPPVARNLPTISRAVSVLRYLILHDVSYSHLWSEDHTFEMDIVRIAERINTLREWQKELELEIEELQRCCSHPVFEDGYSMVACVQPIKICVACGFGKPIDYGTQTFGGHYSIH